MKRTFKKPLTLATQTLRTLDQQDLAAPAGGTSRSIDNDCDTMKMQTGCRHVKI
jgi:hypothetical protein